jgi:hypothetical protein
MRQELEKPMPRQKPNRRAATWQTDRNLKKRATMIAYLPKSKDQPRGWYVRDYHSPVVMKLHLEGKPHPTGQDWQVAYCDTGPFPSEAEARAFALGGL